MVVARRLQPRVSVEDTLIRYAEETRLQFIM